MSERAWMTTEGRWGLEQEIDGGWQPTAPAGYEARADAEAETARLNAIQPGRWRVRDRFPVGGYVTHGEAAEIVLAMMEPPEGYDLFWGEHPEQQEGT